VRSGENKLGFNQHREILEFTNPNCKFVDQGFLKTRVIAAVNYFQDFKAVPRAQRDDLLRLGITTASPTET